MDYTVIGQRIADYRRQRGYTQQYLAEALDVGMEQLLTEDASNDEDNVLSEIQELLGNTTPKERLFLLETMKTMKQTFRRSDLVE